MKGDEMGKALKYHGLTIVNPSEVFTDKERERHHQARKMIKEIKLLETKLSNFKEKRIKAQKFLVDLPPKINETENKLKSLQNQLMDWGY